MLATDVDVVLLTTPPGFRPEHFEKVVAAGKHCFCEKPVATDARGYRRFLAAAKASRRRNWVCSPASAGVRVFRSGRSSRRWAMGRSGRVAGLWTYLANAMVEAAQRGLDGSGVAVAQLALFYVAERRPSRGAGAPYGR